MTREQRLEEMLHHAHERGYYHELMSKSRELDQLYPKMEFYERWEKAYHITKSEFYESQPTDQLSR